MKKESISILVVDDEVPFLQVVQSLLEPEGYLVKTATDGVAAINMLQQ